MISQIKRHWIELLTGMITLWYLSAYGLQAFPAGLTSLIITFTIMIVAFVRPQWGLALALFIVPLTLSLGKHLPKYLEANAPPYLPYAEIILIALLFGWVCHFYFIRHEHNDDVDDLYTLDEITPQATSRTSIIGTTAFWLMTTWVLLSIIGTIPALYRNLSTYTELPLSLIFVKIAFAPVWGMNDPFFPITASLRIFLAWAMLVYTQKVIFQQHKSINAVVIFVSSMTIVAGYAIVQALFDIGYSKGGRPSRYAQSTFHDNESFATFCLVAFVVLIAYYLYRSRLVHTLLPSRLWKIATFSFLFILSSLLTVAVVISTSRAIMLLTLFFLIILLVIQFILSIKQGLTFKQSCFRYVPFLIGIIVLPIIIANSINPYSLLKTQRLFDDYQLFNTVDDNNDITTLKQITRDQTGSLTLTARAKLWKSALQMIQDTYGAGIGTGLYYRFTGFLRYQALPFTENAHMYWLQNIAELGWIFIIISLMLLLLPISVCYQKVALLRQQESLDHDDLDDHWRTHLNQFALAAGLTALWLCNIAGQSLLQFELILLYAMLLGYSLHGNKFLCFNADSFPQNKLIFWVLSIILIIQASLWTWTTFGISQTDLNEFKQEKYSYAFDHEGHRYLEIGQTFYENITVPFDDAVIEFRVKPAGQNVSPEKPLEILINTINEDNQIVNSHLFIVQSDESILSLFLPLRHQAMEKLILVFKVNRLYWTGNLLVSEERKGIGLHYYGYRWNPSPETE